MAYLNKKLFDYLDEQNGQAPALQAANPVLSVAGNQIDTAKQTGNASAASKTPNTGTGTLGGTRSNKWVNIQDYLKANPSISDMAQRKGNELITGEQSAFSGAADPLRKTNYKATRYDDNQVSDLLTPGGDYDVGKLKSALEQDYSGPMSVDFDAKGREGFIDARKLGDRSTATDVLAKKAIQTGNYGMGLRGLDSSLLGAEAAYGGVAQGLNKDLDNFLKSSQDEQKALAAKATGFKEDAAGARADTGTKIKGFSDKELENLQKQSDTTNAEEKVKRENFVKAFADWQVNHPDAAPWAGGVRTGKDVADQFNIGSDDQYTALANAAGLLGQDQKAVGRQGKFEGSKIVDAAAAQGKSVEELAADLGITLEQVGGLPEKLNRYQWIAKHRQPSPDGKNRGLPPIGTPGAQIPVNRQYEATNPELINFYNYIARLGSGLDDQGQPRFLPA